jgi:hypothetical protein
LTPVDGREARRFANRLLPSSPPHAAGRRAGCFRWYEQFHSRSSVSVPLAAGVSYSAGSLVRTVATPASPRDISGGKCFTGNSYVFHRVDGFLPFQLKASLLEQHLAPCRIFRRNTRCNVAQTLISSSVSVTNLALTGECSQE